MSTSPTTRPESVLAGRYALEERLGRSATGMVWLANDTLLDRRVTVKLVHPRLADDPAFASALEAEVRRLAGLSDAHLARLLDSGADGGVGFLVREHIEGRSLRVRLAEQGPLPPPETVRIIHEVLTGLGAAHASGVLHLALDPDDVLVRADGSVAITDLGIGGAVAASRPAEALELLGEDRLAPEQRSAGPVDVRTDVYAAGALAFELVTGEPPRDRTSARAVRPDVPRALDRAIARALDPDPARRFPDVEAFARALPPAASADELLVAPGRGGGLLSLLGVPLLIVGVAAALIAFGLGSGTIEVGGPLGIRPAHDDAPSPATVRLRAELPVSAVAVDPFGDGSELGSNAPLAVDGDLATAWRSEDYFDGELRKPGIGLVLDLGRPRTIVGLRFWTPHPGFTYQVAAGPDPEALVEQVGVSQTADPLSRLALQATGRYVLIWVTSVVPTDDGNRAEIAEARVVVEVPGA